MALIEHIVANSDLLDIQTSHRETRWIQYSNENDYASIDYSDSPVFGIRIWSKFYEPEEPEENESEEISDESIVKLMGSVKSQRLLEIESIPPYMLKKLKQIFQHNTIYIAGVYWEKEGAVEKVKIEDTFPFFLAKVLLTEKDGEYLTNVYGETTLIS